jgi:hypothetical protein
VWQKRGPRCRKPAIAFAAGLSTDGPPSITTVERQLDGFRLAEVQAEAVCGAAWQTPSVACSASRKMVLSRALVVEPAGEAVKWRVRYDGPGASKMGRRISASFERWRDALVLNAVVRHRRRRQSHVCRRWRWQPEPDCSEQQSGQPLPRPRPSCINSRPLSSDVTGHRPSCAFQQGQFRVLSRGIMPATWAGGVEEHDFFNAKSPERVFGVAHVRFVVVIYRHRYSLALGLFESI